MRTAQYKIVHNKGTNVKGVKRTTYTPMVRFSGVRGWLQGWLCLNRCDRYEEVKTANKNTPFRMNLLNRIDAIEVIRAHIAQGGYELSKEQIDEHMTLSHNGKLYNLAPQNCENTECEC